MTDTMSDAMLALADKIETSTKKLMASGYEEYSTAFWDERKLMIDALRAAARPAGGDRGALATRLSHMSKWFTDQSYEATTLREARDALITRPAGAGEVVACQTCGGQSPQFCSDCMGTPAPSGRDPATIEACATAAGRCSSWESTDIQRAYANGRKDAASAVRALAAPKPQGDAAAMMTEERSTPDAKQ